MDDSRARIPLESDEEFYRSLERPGDSRSQRPSALQAEAPAELSPGHSIEPFSDHLGFFSYTREPLAVPANAGWYRRRAEDLGDLTAELIYEGLDGTAYGQAKRAAHYGRLALSLYAMRRDEWMVPGHAGNFL